MNQKYYMTWDDFFHRLNDLQNYWSDALSYFINPKHINVYGIPRGGMITAAFCKNWNLVHDPDLAHIIIDDIIDSGKTKEKYENKFWLDKGTFVPVVGLIDKFSNPEHKKLGWIVFPWESDKENKEDINDHAIRMIEYNNKEVNEKNIFNVKTAVYNVLNFDDR